MTSLSKPRTTHNLALVMGEKANSWKEVLKTYGVPDFDIQDPPWIDGWQNVSPNGKLFTRVQDWMFKQHSIKLYSEDKRNLSNQLHAFVVPSGFTALVDDDLQWAPGTFGDKTSCFFGGKRQAWGFIKKLGGAAMKVHNAEGKAVARCLMLPHPAGWPMFFNTYGYDTHMMATIHSTLWPITDENGVKHLTYLPVTVDGHINIPIHINDGCMWVSAPHILPEDNVNLSAQEFYDGSRMVYHMFCEVCYTRVRRDPSLTMKRGNKHSAVICEECSQKPENDPAVNPRFAEVTVHMHRVWTEPAAQGGPWSYMDTSSVPRFSSTGTSGTTWTPTMRARAQVEDTHPDDRFPDWLSEYTTPRPESSTRRTAADRLTMQNVEMGEITESMSTALDEMSEDFDLRAWSYPLEPEQIGEFFTRHQARVWFILDHYIGTDVGKEYLHSFIRLANTGVQAMVEDDDATTIHQVLKALYCATIWAPTRDNTATAVYQGEYYRDICSAMTQARFRLPNGTDTDTYARATLLYMFHSHEVAAEYLARTHEGERDEAR